MYYSLYYSLYYYLIRYLKRYLFSYRYYFYFPYYLFCHPRKNHPNHRLCHHCEVHNVMPQRNNYPTDTFHHHLLLQQYTDYYHSLLIVPQAQTSELKFVSLHSRQWYLYQCYKVFSHRHCSHKHQFWHLYQMLNCF